MDIEFDKVQMDIAKEARRFLERECPMEFVRDMSEDQWGFTQDIWAKMAEMDWMAIRIPEAYGGMGMGQQDLNVVLEEMGRALLPGPFFSTVLLAAEAIIEAGDDSQKEYYLSKIARGDIRGTLALHEPDGGGDLGYVQMEARADGDGFVLNGTKLFVPDAHVSDFLICAARTQPGKDPAQGLTLFLVDCSAEGVSISFMPTMDGTRKLCSVEFSGVQVNSDEALGEVHAGWMPLRRALQRAQVGLCAECIGGTQRAMQIATGHAKVRIQFDQPIGAFQAVKHRCADMYVGVESSRSVLYWAAWAQDHADPEEASLSASVAKVYCSEAYSKATNSAIQILGATGISWEHDIHLYLKRAKGNEVALGDPVFHREQVIRLLGDYSPYPAPSKE